MTNDTVNQKFVNVVIGARVGDAMGTPTEGLSADDISSRFGWVTTFKGDGTDDSLMATVLSETIARTEGWPTLDDWATDIVRHRSHIHAKKESFFVSVMQMLEKLNVGYRPSEAAIGNMPSSSSAMCIWPIGLLNAGHPQAAAQQAYELARLIHINDADHCTDAAASIAAAVAAGFLPGASVSSILDAAIATIRPVSGKLFRSTLLAATKLATDSDSYEAFRAAYQQIFTRPIMCDSLETVPAAFGVAVLAKGDVRTAVEYGANFGHDADTIACMVGALCGALTDSVPGEWIESLGSEAVASAEGVADGLLIAARQRATEQQVRLTAAATVLADH